MSIRPLDSDDAAQFRTLRLRGLQEKPLAFASSHEEESNDSLEVVAERLRPKEGSIVFGAFSNELLVAVAGLHREELRKLSHKALLWGVYVAPEVRRAGWGHRLLSHVLTHARTTLGVRQVTLSVNAQNQAAIDLYRKLGFVPYGLEPGYMLVDGQLHDELHMLCVVDPSR